MSAPLFSLRSSRRLRQPERGLPVCRAEMDALGWDELDVLLVTGNPAVDHPAFGEALLGRLLVACGFRTGLVAQPDWRSPEALRVMGRPRLLAGVSAGALDSMLAHYTAFRRRRSDDPYAPGGKAGARPDRAVLVYANLARRAFPGLPVVMGGIEASLRRTVHYDFWSDRMRGPVLLDAKAELLVYGMGERALLEAAARLDAGAGLQGIPGTVTAASGAPVLPAGAAPAELPSLEDIAGDPRRLMEATLAVERQVHRGGPWLLQRAGSRAVLLAPPAEPLGTDELDALYALPFSRRAHPSVLERVPALEMVQHSVTAHRGCGGGCSFCALSLHQGRQVASRSEASLLAEVRQLTGHPDFRGTVTDLGGPTANLWGARCARAVGAPCSRPSCLAPRRCRHLRLAQRELLRLLDEAAGLPGVRHLRVSSGVRHDLLLEAPELLGALVSRFTGGQLKVAPEHTEPQVLGLMRKPQIGDFERFLAIFEQVSRKAGKEQFVVPYLMSGFPGCTDEQMDRLARWLARRGWHPRQVQCFVPTPGTVATAMFAGGVDPSGRPIFVARGDGQRRRQHDRFGLRGRGGGD